MSKMRMKQQGEGLRNQAQNNRGGKEANPSKDIQGSASTKRGEKAKSGRPRAGEITA